jgi:hypothetical protein
MVPIIEHAFDLVKGGSTGRHLVGVIAGYAFTLKRDTKPLDVSRP